ncbi:MAG: DUF3300 domain-containing protein [Methylomonas sp.]
MTHYKPRTVPYCRYVFVLRAMVIPLAILTAGCDKDEQEAGKSQPATQAPPVQNVQPSPSPQTPPQPAPVSKPLTDLESLVAPIALYPDPLLAELLVASTYPLEVVQAARWLETKPDLATLSSKNWDASIMRLASVPQVITMMNDHLDWTTQLGDAFLAKPSEVMDVIQNLRKRAKDTGFLKDTPEQKVTAQAVAINQVPESAGAAPTPAGPKKEVITIKPAKSDTIYVPQYNPEVVYQAPMAPPPTTGYPSTTVVNVNAAAPAYYPTYPATTTTSSSESMANFATGAVVGGLLTWGIMEWADDHDDEYQVGHYYGNTVCHNDNCWHGGGYYGDRGNVNYNRNTNISGNDININRRDNFSPNNLKATQRPAGWQPDPQHRRGQAYPDAVQQRLGGTQQPALAGQRLGAAQTLPASVRGFAEAGQQSAAGALPPERRPSSADVRQQLAQKPGTQAENGSKLTQNRPTARDIQGQLGQAGRDDALQGLKNSGQASRLDSQRGANSRRTSLPVTRESPARGGAQTERPRTQALNNQPQLGQGRAAMSQSADRSQVFAGREQAQQQIATQRRSETARPNAFESSRNPRATQSFSQRGASSFQRSSVGGGGFSRSGGGGGGFSRGGGGGGRRR